MVTPYGLMELGLLAVMLALFPRAPWTRLRPFAARSPLLALSAWGIALLLLLAALYGRFAGVFELMRAPLMVGAVIYWAFFTNMDDVKEKPQAGGEQPGGG